MSRSLASINAMRAASSSSGAGSTEFLVPSSWLPEVSSWELGSGNWELVVSLIRNLHDFRPDHHRAEVVPSGADHLRDVDDEEDDVADRQPEVEEARHRIAAEERCQPGELRRFVDG